MKVGHSFETSRPNDIVYNATHDFYGSVGSRIISTTPLVQPNAERGSVGGSVMAFKSAEMETTLSQNLNNLGDRVAVAVEYNIAATQWVGLERSVVHRSALVSEISRLQHQLMASVAPCLSATASPPPATPQPGQAPLNFCPDCGQRFTVGRFCQACRVPLPSR